MSEKTQTPADRLGATGDTLVSLHAPTVGAALDAIAQAAHVVIQASPEIRSLEWTVTMKDVPAAMLIGDLVAGTGAEWDVLPERPGLPPVLQMWKPTGRGAKAPGVPVR